MAARQLSILGTLLGVILAGVGAARADGPPKTAPTPEQAADAARAAFTAGDDAALRAVATARDPDAWAVIEVLLAVGARDAAGAVAKVAPERDREALAAYANRPTREGDEARAEVLGGLLAAFRAGRHADVVAQGGRFPAEPRDVTFVRARHTVALSLARGNDASAAVAASADAAEAAEALGWLRRAATLRYLAGNTAFAAGDPAGAEREWAKEFALQERSGEAEGAANALVNVGNARAAQGKHDEAAAAYQDAIQRARAVRALRTVALAAGNLATLLGTSGKDDLSWRIESVEAWRSVGDGDRLALALVLSARARAERGDASGARAALAEAEALLNRLGPAATRSGEVRYHGAKALNYLGEPRRGLAWLDAALEAAGPRGPGRWVANLRMGRAWALDALGRLGAARAEMESALPLLRASGEHGDLATGLGTLATLRLMQGDLPSAREAMDEALALARRLGMHGFDLVLRVAEARLAAAEGTPLARLADLDSIASEQAVGGSVIEAGHTLAVLAELSERGGDAERALAAWDRSVSLWQQAGATGRVSGAWFWRAGLHERRGESAAAVESYATAVATARSAADAPRLARALTNQGDLLCVLGRRVDGRRCLEEAIEIARAIDDPGIEGVALNLLAVREELALGVEAKGVLQEAALAASVRAADRGAEVSVCINLAGTRVRQGRHADALELLARVRRLVGESGPAVDRAWIAHREAQAHVGLRDGPAAERAAREALRLGEEQGDAAAIGRGALDLGNALLLNGDLPAAGEAFAQVEAHGAERAGRAGRAMVELRSGRLREATAAAREALTSLATDSQALPADEAAELRVTAAEVAGTGLDAAMALGDAAEAFHFLEAGRSGALLAALGSAGEFRAGLRTGAARDAMRDLRVREAAAIREVSTAKSRGDADAFARASAELTAARAARRTLLRDMDRAARTAGAGKPQGPVTLSDVQGALRPGEALVLHERRQENVVTLVVLPDDAHLIPPVPLSGTPLDVHHHVAELRAFFVDPLALPATVTCVLVSPFEEWGELPYGLLWQGRDVALVPSGGVLRHLRAHRPPKGEGILAVGDPVYGAKDGGGAGLRLRDGGALLPLPATGVEAKAFGTRVLVGPEATRARVFEALGTRRWRGLHFACHGLLHARGTQRPGLALTAADEDDGLLSDEDVLEHGCPADVVVLSACRSGLGRVAPREGLLGLPRSFLLAGASSVVASQAPVADETALALMRAFHAALATGSGPARALRTAQEALAKAEATRDPKHWADWVVWGLPE